MSGKTISTFFILLFFIYSNVIAAEDSALLQQTKERCWEYSRAGSTDLDSDEIEWFFDNCEQKSYNVVHVKEKNPINLSCSPVKDPFFTIDNGITPELSVLANFDFINSSDRHETVKASITYKTNSNNFEGHGTVTTTGHNRFKYCQYRPFRIDLPPDSGQSLVGRYYLTTHCGERNDTDKKFLINRKKRDQEERLQVEELIYSTMRYIYPIAPASQMLKASYIDGKVVRGTGLSFAVEDLSNMAKRCGLSEISRSTAGGYNFDRIFYSEYWDNMLRLFNVFWGNNDWNFGVSKQLDNFYYINAHNVMWYLDQNSYIVPVPYDFDLNYISYPDYTKNKGFDVNTQSDFIYENLMLFHDRRNALDIANRLKKATSIVIDAANRMDVSIGLKHRMIKLMIQNEIGINRFLNNKN